ncbi:hypothetical protein BGZ67_008500 [Mortierella alpina]|nr:hypothetical protein BGZ67_008500 [Mortierella alpina]
MARITLSTLVSFLVVLLVATAAEASGVFRLYNGDSWAKNFPSGGTRPPFNTGVTVDDNFASIYERWTIERFEEGYRIRNAGTGFWLTARKSEVTGSSEFDERYSKWYIEKAGEDKFTIKAPNQDLVVTVRRTQDNYPATLYLEPAEGSESQRWRIERVDGYYSKGRQ